MFQFFPETVPYVQYLHAAQLYEKVIWVASGGFGVTTLLTLTRQPVIALVICVLFSCSYIYGSLNIWYYGFGFLCWLAIFAIALCVLSIWVKNNSDGENNQNPTLQL